MKPDLNKTPKQKVADIILKVLDGKITIEKALLMFPDTDDRSILTAWHALAHLDADEHIRIMHETFKEEQNEYIKMIALMFKKNRPLPDNIINGYKTTFVMRANTIEERKTHPLVRIYKAIKNCFRFIT